MMRRAFRRQSQAAEEADARLHEEAEPPSEESRREALVARWLTAACGGDSAVSTRASAMDGDAPCMPTDVSGLNAGSDDGSRAMELLFLHALLGGTATQEEQTEKGDGSEGGDSVCARSQHLITTTLDWLSYHASEEELFAILPSLLRALTTLLPPLLPSSDMALLYTALLHRAIESERITQRLFWILVATEDSPGQHPINGATNVTAPSCISEGTPPDAPVTTLRRQLVTMMGSVARQELELQLRLVHFLEGLANPAIKDGWEEHTVGDGQRYYYNAQTGETSWEKPTYDIPRTPTVQVGSELRSVFDSRVHLPISRSCPLCRVSGTGTRRYVSITFDRWGRDGNIDFEAKPPPHEYSMMVFGVTTKHSKRERHFLQAQLVTDLLGVFELVWKVEKCEAFVAGGGPNSQLHIRLPIDAPSIEDGVNAPADVAEGGTAAGGAIAAMNLVELVPGQRTIAQLASLDPFNPPRDGESTKHRPCRDTLGEFLIKQAIPETKWRRQCLLTCIQRLMWARSLLALHELLRDDGSGVDSDRQLVPPNLDIISKVGECPLLGATHCRWEPNAGPQVKRWIWKDVEFPFEKLEPELRGEGLGLEPEPEPEPEPESRLQSKPQARHVAAAEFHAYCLGDNADSQILLEKQENLLNSIAGVCVAIYVLGVGGRHMDNMVISPSGGVFFVNCKVAFCGKRQFEITRERNEFGGLFGRLDDPLLVALGGFGSVAFTQMVERAVIAFVASRRHARLLLSTLALVTLAPSLDQDDGTADTQYVRDHLHLEMTEEDAAGHFRNKLVGTAKAGTERGQQQLPLVNHLQAFQ